MKCAGFLPVVALVAVMGCAGDAEPEPHRAAAAGLAVDATWLADNVDAADVVVVQVAPDEAGAPELPGVRFLPLSAVAIEHEGNVNELPPLDAMRSTFEQLGIGDSTHVILVGDPLHAARAFVALDVLGHTRVSLLDGGYAAWSAAGSPQPNGNVTASAGRMTGSPRTDLVVDADYVRERLNVGEVQLVDARPADQFAEGRIPGASSLFWQETLVPDQPRLLPDAELHALFDNAGGDAATSFVIYCRTGMQASFLYFVARHLGYDVRMYDGSYADWTARGLPVEP